MLGLGAMLVTGSLPDTEEHHTDVFNPFVGLLGLLFSCDDWTTLGTAANLKQWRRFSKIPATSAIVYTAENHEETRRERFLGPRICRLPATVIETPTFFHYDDHRPLQPTHHSSRHHKVNMILPPSNGDDDFSGPSSASEMMSPPRTPSNLMKYTVELVVVVVLKLTMTFHKICPSLASHGDYTHSPPSMIVGTSTSVAPPQELIWPPSSFKSCSHAHPTSTTNNTFLPVFKCHGDEFFSKQHPIQEVHINCPRCHCHHTAAATPYNSYFLRIFDHSDGFLGFKRLYRLQGSHHRNILSPNAIGVDESYAGSFEHAWYADGEQISKSKQPAGPPASGSGTIFPRCLRLEDITISPHPQWLDSMKYEQWRDILTSGSKRSKEGIFKNRIRWNNDKSGPGPWRSTPSATNVGGSTSSNTSDASSSSTSLSSISSPMSSAPIIATSSISTISTSLMLSSTFSMTSSLPLTSSSMLPVTSTSFLPPSITMTFVASTTSQTDTIMSSPSILMTSEESSTTSLATIVTSISGQLTAYNASQSFLGFYLLLSKLYLNSYLASLNTRQGLCKMSNQPVIRMLHVYP
ncbi:hypothetical protein IW262DRAFT_1469068 [Armillaria fumosa]|nr:hypothetical protein IW262DRAFT_1469068 [Armillaria fumosa]